ncbi:hypothetical protein PYR66_10540 [Klebsiella aerogenes]|nr:hypothetical protein PYR66_10540 [Klebsiella aerogenes]
MSLFLTSFIFEKKEYDDVFYQLDGWIDRYTQSLDGYIGMESYTNAASGRIINNYYWRDRQSMELMMNNLQHQQAKAQGRRWIAGYQTIIAEIEGSHNMNLPHPLADYPLRYQAQCQDPGRR